MLWWKHYNTFYLFFSRASAEIFQEGTTLKLWLAYPFQVADNAMQMDVHETLHPFFPTSSCWLSFNYQYFVWNVFYTSAIRNGFSFHKLPNIHLFEHFLQIEFNNNQRPEQHERWANKKGRHSNCFQALRRRTVRWQNFRTTYQG